MKKRKVITSDDENSDSSENEIQTPNYNSSISTNISNTMSSNLSNSFSLLNISNKEKNKNTILEKIKSKNSIICSDNEDFKISILKTFLDLNKNSKIIVLVLDMKISNKFSDLFKDSKIDASYLQGKKGKKIKNNYKEFQNYFIKSDIYFANPDVFYKLLSIGFITIFDIQFIIFDECQNCIGNHPYYLIMTEFYLFYLTNGDELKQKLPKIIGLTSFPFKKIYQTDEIMINEMKNLCENLDSQIIIDPECLNYNISNYFINNDWFIEYSSHKDNDKYEKMLQVFLQIFFKPFIELALENYIMITREELNENLKTEKINEYLKYINKIFNAKDFDEFIKFQSLEKELSINWEISTLYKKYEKIERQLFLIFENLDIYSLNEFFKVYLELYENELNKDISILSKNEIKAIIKIFNRIRSAIDLLINKKNFIYQTNKFEKLLNYLNNNKNSKIIIFVNQRIIANILEKRLKLENNDNVSSIIGINNNENLQLIYNPSNSIKEIENSTLNFQSKEKSILITTYNFEELSNMKYVNLFIVYSEFSNNKNYSCLIDRVNKEKTQYCIFTQNIKKISDTINNYFLLNNKLIELFKKDICFELKSQTYIKDKFKDFKYFYYIPETQAKLTLKNVNIIYNECINSFENNNIKLNITTDFIEDNSKYKCRILIKGNGLKVNTIISSSHNDKQSAESECFMRFLINLYKKKKIDNNFRVII